MFRFFRGIFAASALILASCATSPRAAHRIDNPQSVRSIDLISTVPNTIFTRSDGLFTEDKRVYPVEWNLHDATLSVMRNNLENSYSVKAELFDASSFGPVDFSAGFESLKTAVKRRIKPNKYDLVVVIAPISPTQTSASLWRHRGIYEIAFSYIVVALNGETFSVVGIAYSGTPSYVDISELLGSFKWAGGPISSMKQADKVTLFGYLDQFIHRNIPVSLRALGLRTGSVQRSWAELAGFAFGATRRAEVRALLAR